MGVFFWGESPSDSCNGFSIKGAQLSRSCHWDSTVLCPRLDLEAQEKFGRSKKQGNSREDFRLRKGRSDLFLRLTAPYRSSLKDLTSRDTLYLSSGLKGRKGL